MGGKLVFSENAFANWAAFERRMLAALVNSFVELETAAKMAARRMSTPARKRWVHLRSEAATEPQKQEGLAARLA